MQKLILFICLIFGLYFSTTFDTAVVKSGDKIEKSKSGFVNNMLEIAEI